MLVRSDARKAPNSTSQSLCCRATFHGLRPIALSKVRVIHPVVDPSLLIREMYSSQVVSFTAFGLFGARARSTRRANSISTIRCEFAPGAKVRVASPVKVYHVGKFKDGLDLQGMEGVVQADARQYNGMQLSATLPWKVQFEAPGPDGKAVKVIAHLVSSNFSSLLQACLLLTLKVVPITDANNLRH